MNIYQELDKDELTRAKEAMRGLADALISGVAYDRLHSYEDRQRWRKEAWIALRKAQPWLK